MKVKVVACTAGQSAPYHFVVSYIINDTLALDAGGLGFFCPLPEQEAIRHLLLSHSHADHIASLPIFVENVFKTSDHAVQVYGNAAVLDCLRKDVFNNRVWPDFIRMSTPALPFLGLHELHAEKPLELDGVRITPVEVNHVVPTLGFVIEDATSAVVFFSDTGPTERMWDVANGLPNLKAVFLEATFPESMAQLAVVSKHLTPKMFDAELKKLRRPAKVFAVHLKAQVHTQVVEELAALGRPEVTIAEPGQVYHF
jgi:ribonuclease BN (tRNA processing enzyme)